MFIEKQLKKERKLLLVFSKNIFNVNNEKEFTEKIQNGGFLTAFWCGNNSCEENIKQKTKATIRCIPFKLPVDQSKEEGYCIVCNKDSNDS